MSAGPGRSDCVGGAALAYVLRTLRHGAAVAASGNAGGPALVTTVFPFILRGVALLGMDSAALPIDERRRLWERAANDLRPADGAVPIRVVELGDLTPALEAILAGRADGRWVVRVGD